MRAIYGNTTWQPSALRRFLHGLWGVKHIIWNLKWHWWKAREDNALPSSYFGIWGSLKSSSTQVRVLTITSIAYVCFCVLARKGSLFQASVSQGAMQNVQLVRAQCRKQRAKKIKKARREEASSRRAFLYFFARCFLRCALVTERLEEAREKEDLKLRGFLPWPPGFLANGSFHC